ncbi:MAG: hypothetical protein IPK12_21255 [Gemmatimonadetes bacterium]|nr:hypothetical protein [Gemmatimonadota bacterium]
MTRRALLVAKPKLPSAARVAPIGTEARTPNIAVFSWFTVMLVVPVPPMLVRSKSSL